MRLRISKKIILPKYLQTWKQEQTMGQEETDKLLKMAGFGKTNSKKIDSKLVERMAVKQNSTEK